MEKLIVRSLLSGIELGVNDVKMWWLCLIWATETDRVEHFEGEKSHKAAAVLRQPPAWQTWFCNKIARYGICLNVLTCWNVSKGLTSQLWWWRRAGWLQARVSSWRQIETRPVRLWWTSWRFVIDSLKGHSLILTFKCKQFWLGIKKNIHQFKMKYQKPCENVALLSWLSVF